MQREEEGQGPTRAGAPMGAEPAREGEPMGTTTMGGGGGRRMGGAAVALAALAILLIVGLIVWWILADNDAVLVVTDPQQQISRTLDEGDDVQVTGSVRLFDFEEFDGIGDVGDFGDFEGTPVIVAESVQPAAGEGNQAQNGDVIDRISDEDTALVGQQVTVTGEVAERVGVSSFLLEEE